MHEPSSLIDRCVIVTGGSRGIGREMALALVEAGARVAIVATAESAPLEQTVKAAEAIGGRERVLPLIGDVIAKKWDEKLPLEARVVAARDSGAELPKIM